MEFNGFTSTDFEFFKKKDKLEKDEYEKGRNEVKNHFRGLCYEIQKMYHAKTGGVFELQKDFQNFNRRSSHISVEHVSGISKIFISLNYEGLDIELIFQARDEQQCKNVLDMLANKKNIIWEQIIASKFMHIYIDQNAKNRKLRCLALNSFDMNSKTYESLIKIVEGNINEGKFNLDIGIGYSYNKKECLRQGKMILNTSYDAAVKMMELREKLTT